jgi:YD repeat-containing protein
MSYTTSGVKVDQVASWVGMGWNLNAGGTISRTVRGMPDEDAQVREFMSYSLLNGYKTSNPTLYYTHIARIAQKDYADYVPDIFNYNIDGFSGSFYLDASWNAVFIKKEAMVKVEVINNSILNGFIVTAPNGTTYRFDIYEESKQRMVCGSGNPGTAVYQPTSWLLTKITHPFGDEVTFTYGNTTDYFYTSNLTETYNKNSPTTAPQGASLPPEGVTKCGVDTYVKGKVLTKIASNRNIGEVIFTATKSRSDVNDYKLDDITIKDPFNKQIKKYSFAYTQVQSTISYNGASTFPGTTGNDTKYRLFLDNITEKDANNNSTNGKKHSFDYESRTSLPRRLSLSQDLLGYYNGKTNNSMLPNTHGGSYNITRGDRSFDFNSAKKGILTKVTYPTKGYTMLEYESGPSAIRVKKVKSLAKVGGQEKIVRYYYTSKENAVSGGSTSTQVPIGSNGFIVTKPSVIEYIITNPGTTGTTLYHYFDRIEFSTKGIAPMYMTNANHFLYNTVTIGYGDNFEGGGVEKKFSVSTDSNGGIMHGSQILDGVKTNTGLLNGTLTQETYFKKNGATAVLAKKVDYVHENLGINPLYLDGYIGNIVFDSPIGPQYSYNGTMGYDINRIQTISQWRAIDTITTTEYLTTGNIITTQANNYFPSLYPGQPNEVTTSNSLNGITDKVKYHYPSTGTLYTQNRLEVLKTEKFENTSSSTPFLTVNNVYGTKEGLYVPTAIQTSAQNNALEDRIVFHSYYSSGNVKEVSKKDGTHVVYIWGYNQTKPIAKIDNITYSQIQSSVSNLQNLSNADNDRTYGNAGNEGALRTALETLRTSLPSDAVMTYFTYDPLIGVTSTTDLRGRTTYYHYDSFGRLQYVRDHDNKILTKNEYNYKN